ncbi:MAG: hypothetical protein M0029_04180 [Actinomycetota bacterium]|nr:hypothetical protein [Actinomycetota bacterium]
MTTLRARRGARFSALAPVAAAVATAPQLWPTAVAALVRLVPRRWWCRPPFLPVPDAAWWAFRMETAYGSPGAVPTAEDVVSYLHWCRATARLHAEATVPSGRRSPAGRTRGRGAA